MQLDRELPGAVGAGALRLRACGACASVDGDREAQSGGPVSRDGSSIGYA